MRLDTRAGEPQTLINAYKLSGYGGDAPGFALPLWPTPRGLQGRMECSQAGAGRKPLKAYPWLNRCIARGDRLKLL